MARTVAEVMAAEQCGRRARRARPRPGRPGPGQGAHPRHRRAAGDRPAAHEPGPAGAGPQPAHVLHGQSRHRQDDGRAAHGADPSSPGLHPQRPPRCRHARRPGRPVRRPHGTEDARGAEEGDGRRAVHRRGLLPVPAGQRARLRPGSDRDPAAGDGEQPRRPGRDPGGLRRPHGDLLPVEPRHALAHRASPRVPRLRRGRAAQHRRTHAGRAALPVRCGRARAVPGLHRAPHPPAAVRQRPQHPQRARPRAPAPGEPAVCPARARVDARGPQHDPARRHPRQPRVDEPSPQPSPARAGEGASPHPNPLPPRRERGPDLTGPPPCISVAPHCRSS